VNAGPIADRDARWQGDQARGLAGMTPGRDDAIWRVTGVQPGAGQYGRGGVWEGTLGRG